MVIRFIGLSGPSSSGKTTIAYLLKHIFPNVVNLLHADDFSKEFDEIPIVNGYLDCDGPGAIDYVRMEEVLDYMKHHEGDTPTNFKSWQGEVFPGQEEDSLKKIPASVIQRLKEEVQKSGIDVKSTGMVLVDGFLLYQNPAIREALNVKLFFRLTEKTAKERRFTRQGYGTEARPHEFWKTRDYFERMVWRSYREQHAFMFSNGDVEGDVNEEACKRSGIQVKPGLDRPVDENLSWATARIITNLAK